MGVVHGRRGRTADPVDRTANQLSGKAGMAGRGGNADTAIAGRARSVGPGIRGLALIPSRTEGAKPWRNVCANSQYRTGQLMYFVWIGSNKSRPGGGGSKPCCRCSPRCLDRSVASNSPMLASKMWSTHTRFPGSEGRSYAGGSEAFSRLTPYLLISFLPRAWATWSGKRCTGKMPLSGFLISEL